MIAPHEFNQPLASQSKNYNWTHLVLVDVTINICLFFLGKTTDDEGHNLTISYLTPWPAVYQGTIHIDFQGTCKELISMIDLQKLIN